MWNNVARENARIWPSNVRILAKESQQILRVDQKRTDNNWTQNTEQQCCRIPAPHDMKNVIWVFPILQGGADALTRQGEQLYHLSIAYFLETILAKNYKNPTTYIRFTAIMPGSYLTFNYSILIKTFDIVG